MANSLEVWSVPREWPGERCFIIGGGGSVREQRELIPRLRGRVIAVKHSVMLRPNADVALFDDAAMAVMPQAHIDAFCGSYVVCLQGRWGNQPIFELKRLPPSTRVLRRASSCTEWADDPSFVVNDITGIAGINLAHHFGATEIVLLGFDGGFWGHWWSEQANPYGEGLRPEPGPITGWHRVYAALADDARKKGFRIVNTAPASAIVAFEHQPLEAFL